MITAPNYLAALGFWAFLEPVFAEDELTLAAGLAPVLAEGGLAPVLEDDDLPAGLVAVFDNDLAAVFAEDGLAAALAPGDLATEVALVPAAGFLATFFAEVDDFASRLAGDDFG